MTNDPIVLDIRARDPVDFDVAGSRPIEWGASEYIPVVGHVTEYEGPYEVTPTEDEQALDTLGKLMAQNLVVAPIPTNYGRITYDGTTIHIS